MLEEIDRTFKLKIARPTFEFLTTIILKHTWCIPSFEMQEYFQVADLLRVARLAEYFDVLFDHCGQEKNKIPSMLADHNEGCKLAR